MGPVFVEVLPPVGQQVTGMAERPECGLVLQLVTQPAVELLDESVLHRLARRDVVPADT